MDERPKVATCLWFDGKAEEAANFYVSLIPGSKVASVMRLEAGGPALLVEFTLGGAPYQALNGGPIYRLNEAASLAVLTKDQEETDRLWTKLLEGGGSESRCGWLKDRFGLSWQIVPEAFRRMMGSPDRAASSRVMQAMFGMKKLDVAALEKAFRGQG